MSPITGNHSLFARSPSRFPNSVPRGPPAAAPLNRNDGGKSGFPRSHPCRPEHFRACPFNTCLFPGGTFNDVHPFQRDATGHLPFWSEPFSSFGSSRLTRIASTVHVGCACGICLAPTPRGCWQCRLLPGHPGESPVRRVRCPRSSEPDRYQSRTSG